MKQVIVAGKTDAVISLNKAGVPIRGKTPTIVTIDTPEKQSEIDVLVRMNLIKIVDDSVKEEIVEQAIETSIHAINNTKPKIGRPKGSKNKAIKTVNERIEEAEIKTQQMGSRVIIGMGKGTKEGKMTFSAVDDQSDSPNTSVQASLDAIKQLDAEEQASKEKVVIDESKLAPSEQSGRKAIILTEGKEQSVIMENSIVKGSKDIKEQDPFIDADSGDELDDDAFIKI